MVSHNEITLDLLSETPKIYIPSVSNALEKNIITSDPSLNNKNIYGKRIDFNLDILSKSELLLYDDSLKVYTLKVVSDSAYGMQFFFSNFQIPQGGKLFFFNENKTHIIGGFTHQNNRKNHKFGTRPISGNTIIIEYSEPVNANFSTHLIIEKVVHVFDKGFFDPWSAAGECNKSIACLEEEHFFEWGNESKSVVMILATWDNIYYQWASGVLLNIAGGYTPNNQPYLLTASHAIEEAPDPYSEVEDWVFLFGFEDSECGVTNSNTQFLTPNNSVFGAELLAYDDYFSDPDAIKSDFLLCKLMDNFSTINTNIDVSYAGWDRETEQYSYGLCIHHPSESSKMFSYTETLTTTNFLWDPACETYRFITGWDFWKVFWDIGVTEGGSSGSPIFNMNHKVIGQLWGGASQCEFSSDTPCFPILGPDQPDAFGKFSTSWEEGNFAYYLDPYSTNLTSVETFTPNFCGNGICEPENGEVFPDCSDCPDPNWNGGGGGGSICYLPVSEGFKINDSNDDIVLLCPDYEEITLSSPDDNCLLKIGKEIIESDDSHCEWEESLYCQWSGSLGWKKCNCWHWMYFIGVTECDHSLNPIGDEFSNWFQVLQNTQCLLELPILSDINSMGIALQQGKYYKLKLATSPWGSGWSEGTKYFYVLPKTDELSGEIESGNYFVEEDITIVDATVSINQNVTITAGNSITISPNSLISFGSNFLAQIDPNIISNCLPVKHNQATSKTQDNPSSNKSFSVLDNDYGISNHNGVIQIYPNPTTGFVNIVLNFQSSGNIGVEIQQMNGNIIHTQIYQHAENIILNLSPYPPGIYLLLIKTPEKVYTEKIVLQ